MDESKEVKDCVSIHSSFFDNINTFNSDDDDSFPDLHFIIPGIDEPLLLHRATLGRTSNMLKAIFHGTDNAYCVYDKKCNQVEWKYAKSKTNSTYRSVLVKWLRFCYGEDQTFDVDECPSALAPA